MSSYSGIAPYYDRIFPWDEGEISFLRSVFHSTARRTWLDIGCATGTLLAEFSREFGILSGLDLDVDLLELADEKLSANEIENVELYEADMREIRNLFPGFRFSAVSCLGNTLPHLSDANEIAEFFQAVHTILEPNGKFVFQIINYDRILDGAIRSLPTIEGDCFTFERRYSVLREDGRIDFEIALDDPDRGVEIRETLPLLPVRKSEIERLLVSSGFSECAFYGDYAGNGWKPDAMLLLGVCSI
jgi:Methylase involved in ubiquinone/menaquinone biosynthesis